MFSKHCLLFGTWTVSQVVTANRWNVQSLNFSVRFGLLGVLWLIQVNIGRTKISLDVILNSS